MATPFCSMSRVFVAVVACFWGTHNGWAQEKAKERLPYFHFDAETQKPGDPLPQPPFFPQPWKEAGANHPKRGTIAADPSAPQGKNVFRWEVRDARTTELFHVVKFDRLPEAKPRDYYYAFFVRFDRTTSTMTPSSACIGSSSKVGPPANTARPTCWPAPKEPAWPG